MTFFFVRRSFHRRARLVVALSLLLGLTLPTVAAEPVRIILDVDLAEDVDDAGALAVLHGLANRGEAQILATLVSSKNEWVGPCLDAINTWYGRPDLPIGYQRGHQYGYRNPKNPDRETTSKYAEAVARAFPHDLPRSSDAPEAASLCRKILAAQPDRSVTFVTVGFLTNMRNLLDSAPDEFSKLDGEALVKLKVKQWVCMGGLFPGGRFPDGNGEYNLMWDTAASVRALNDWPTPIVFSGFEIGVRIKVGSVLKQTPAGNPVRACYQHYNGLQDREAWDLTAVLYAVRGARDYWTLSTPGFAPMHARVPHGFNGWIPWAEGPHRYLVEKMATGDVGKALDELLLEPPRSGNPIFQGWYADPEAVIFAAMWSEGGWTGPNYSVAYAIGNSPLGPFQRIGKILQQDPTVATGAGHHSVLQIPGSKDWSIVYHRRPLGEKDGNHRVVCIDRMEFDEQGLIKPVKITFEGVARRTLNPSP